jgi:hypothetical protein
VSTKPGEVQDTHHRDTEDTEVAQRKAFLYP